MPFSVTPFAWENQDLRVYHGTILPYAKAIMDGVDVRRGNLGTDFGAGFYCTTLEKQAWMWALKLSEGTGSLAAVVELSIPRHELARLGALNFFARESDSQDFWSFVHFCRNGATHHGRPAQKGSRTGRYDVVTGPVASQWRRFQLIQDADQISFHTTAAQNLLNRWTKRSMITT